MKKILIITEKLDAHARIVSHALEEKGGMPIRWFINEFITNQHSTLILRKDKNTITLTINQDAINIDDVGLVWFRRPTSFDIPSCTHPDDKSFIEKENEKYIHSLWQILKDSAVWVNPFSSIDKASIKAYQLMKAKECGLKIPDTIISNQKNEIVNFIKRHVKIGVIYKTLYNSYWEENENVFVSHTRLIEIKDLPPEKILKLTPGIFQAYIRKAFEVRATFFGSRCISVKINNSEATDWREIPETDLNICPFELPEKVANTCIALMKKLSIIFGCFDFIVTPEGEFIFLEVNEMGQFLWIEERLPQLKLLDTFCNFLLSFLNGKNSNSSELELKKITNSSLYKKIFEEDCSDQD